MKRKKNEPMPRTPPENLPNIEDLAPIDAETMPAGDHWRNPAFKISTYPDEEFLR